MCGRYASSRSVDELVEEFEVAWVNLAQPQSPDYNIAPTKEVYVVLDRSREDDTPAVRQLRTARWGLVPSWAKDPSVGNKMINARVETAADKPAYRRAFRARRCLVPADGYYEWYTPDAAPDGGRGSVRKQPFFVRPKDGGVMAMAGLYEWWRQPERPAEDPEAWLWTVTILTTDAEDALSRIHPRMPVMVEPDRYEAWLDPDRQDPDELRSLLLLPPATGLLEAYPVSTAVNSVRNNGPHLLDPLPAEEPSDPHLHAGPRGGRRVEDSGDDALF